MFGPEQAGHRRRVRSLGRRALIASVVVPVVVAASVLVGALPSHNGARRPVSSPTTLTAVVSTSTTTTATTLSTTIAAPSSTTTGAPAAPAVTPPATPTAAPATQPPAQPAGYGCAAALAYLGARAAAGFSFECPGYADGHQAMTCIDHAPECPGEQIIVINDPCPAAYMNEAFNSNSWNPSTQSFTDGIDPYGYC